MTSHTAALAAVTTSLFRRGSARLDNRMIKDTGRASIHSVKSDLDRLRGALERRFPD